MKTLQFLRSKIKALFASNDTDKKFSDWEPGFKEKEAYKEERTKWRAFQQVIMFL